jgi:hypothetical protein
VDTFAELHDLTGKVAGRSQMSTRFPCPASATASFRTPGESLLNRPPGVITQGRAPDSPITS